MNQKHISGRLVSTDCDMDNRKETVYLGEQLNAARQKYELLREWIYTTQIGRPPGNFFLSRGYRNIVIYGAGEIGLMLCQELQMTEEIRVICFIDRVKQDNPFGVDTVQRYEKGLGEDVVVVTPIMQFEDIKEQLEADGAAAVVSLKDVILEA